MGAVWDVSRTACRSGACRRRSYRRATLDHLDNYLVENTFEVVGSATYTNMLISCLSDDPRDP